MPQINVLITGNESVNLWMLSMGLEGDDAQFRARQRIRDKIDILFPESKEQAPTKDEEAERREALAKKRELVLSGYEQTALAEGLLKHLKRESLKDVDKVVSYHLAKVCRISKWLNEQIDKNKMVEFTESDDAVVADVIPADEASPVPA